MFKSVNKVVWAFDAEGVPDLEVGSSLSQLSEETTDAEGIQKMWDEGGAYEENPRTYLNTTICRVISIAAVVGKVEENGEVALILTRLPHDVTGPKQISEIENCHVSSKQLVIKSLN